MDQAKLSESHIEQPSSAAPTSESLGTSELNDAMGGLIRACSFRNALELSFHDNNCVEGSLLIISSALTVV